MKTIMGKTEWVDRVQVWTGAKKKDIQPILEAALDAVAEALAEGADVRFIGFGAFRVRQVEARDYRSPLTGEMVHAPAHLAVRFTPSKMLTDRLNGK